MIEGTGYHANTSLPLEYHLQICSQLLQVTQPILLTCDPLKGFFFFLNPGFMILSLNIYEIQDNSRNFSIHLQV